MASQTQRYSSAVTLLPLRELPWLPSTGFEVSDPSQSVEEEQLPLFNRADYYPMRIGAVIKDHYQVVSELGYGTNPTVWLCHDLRYALLPSKYDCSICWLSLTPVKRAGILGAKGACQYSESVPGNQNIPNFGSKYVHLRCSLKPLYFILMQAVVA